MVPIRKEKRRKEKKGKKRKEKKRGKKRKKERKKEMGKTHSTEEKARRDRKLFKCRENIEWIN